MMRNLGGAVGIAVCAAIINDRTNLHFQDIASTLTPANGAMNASAGDAEHGGSRRCWVRRRPGMHAALEQLRALAYREASTLAFADAFRAIMLAFIVATLLVLLLRKVVPPKTAPADAH